MIRAHVIRAVFWRNFAAYFGSATGYVFITVFVALGSILAFWPDEFFKSNLASLHVLNKYFPYLLVGFIPAVTMATWADEKKHGTEELLFTLPVRDVEVLLGKYMANLGIYSVALLFSLSHVAILAWLGKPDGGLLFSTYLGYWLLGAALIPIGMVGSSVSPSTPVAFIVGAVFCLLFTVIGDAPVLPDAITRLGTRWAFDGLTSGLVTARALAYFVSLAAVMLIFNHFILGRRHWRGDAWVHGALRWAFIAATLIAANVMVGRSRAGLDSTAEKLHTLAPETRNVLANIPEDRTVFVHAYVSPEVPKEFVELKATLLAYLRQYAALSNGRLQVAIYEVEKHQPAAREALENYGITARPSKTDAESDSKDIYLGLAFVSGAQEVVIPFFHRNLAVEYELTRAVRVVTQKVRRTVGILATDLQMMGGWDMNTFQRIPEWQIVKELQRQYNVVRVSPDEAYPDDLDVLIAPSPSSLSQPQMDKLAAYLKSPPPALAPAEAALGLCDECKKKTKDAQRRFGRIAISKTVFDGLCQLDKNNLKPHVRKNRSVLIFEDPMPLWHQEVAPWRPKAPPGGRMSMYQPPPEPKGDLAKFLQLFHLKLDKEAVVWQRFDPHRGLHDFDIHYLVFAHRLSGANPAFNESESVSSGLQEMLFLLPGHFRSDGGGEVIPLIRVNPRSGTVGARKVRFDSPPVFDVGVEGEDTDDGYRVTQVLSDSVAEKAGLKSGDVIVECDGESIQTREDFEELTEFEKKNSVALKLKDGRALTLSAPKSEEFVLAVRSKGEIDAIAIADVDLIEDPFFLQREGRWFYKEIEFDNIGFVLNCVDALAGDEAIVSLRKRRAKHRTLERIESRAAEFEKLRQEEEEKAHRDARKTLRDAKRKFRAQIKEVRDKTDVDENSKRQELAALEESTNRKLEQTTKEIEDRKKRDIEESRARRDREIEAIKTNMRWIAVMTPPIPALLLAALVFFLRVTRERQTIPRERWVKS